MKEVDWQKTGKILLAWSGVVAVAASVMAGGTILVMGNNLPPQIPLFYSLPWGEDQLAAPPSMWQAVAVVWAAWGLAWAVARSGKEKVLTAFVAGTALISGIIIVLGLIRIVLIVT